ncbi:hypothetical protein NPIL_24541 [Nephila pilipes]|uniref:Uncharacterized protein n=1 Tax=Nephila pilipes TaxID=299642 RepID=A0A8X6QUF2_NEPPI|nr:hypothetical protein NPIL_24541 [Nephila pilipes]
MSSVSFFVRGSSIENLWKLDILGIRDSVAVQSRKEMETAALNHFKETVTVNNEGRYVHLPWGIFDHILNSNDDICEDV